MPWLISHPFFVLLGGQMKLGQRFGGSVGCIFAFRGCLDDCAMFPGFRAWCREVQRVGSGRSVTPPARDALSMLAVGAGVVRKRSEGSTGTGGDVEASQVLRRHPPVTDDRLVSSQGQEGWGRGGSAASTGGDLWGAPGGPAASCCSPPAPGARIWRARPRRRNASVWIVAPLERQCLREGWRGGGAAAK